MIINANLLKCTSLLAVKAQKISFEMRLTCN